MPQMTSTPNKLIKYNSSKHNASGGPIADLLVGLPLDVVFIINGYKERDHKLYNQLVIHQLKDFTMQHLLDYDDEDDDDYFQYFKYITPRDIKAFVTRAKADKDYYPGRLWRCYTKYVQTVLDVSDDE
jgi:hypothetical protein